jgi:hypothetical protein
LKESDVHLLVQQDQVRFCLRATLTLLCATMEIGIAVAETDVAKDNAPLTVAAPGIAEARFLIFLPFNWLNWGAWRECLSSG